MPANTGVCRLNEFLPRSSQTEKQKRQHPAGYHRDGCADDQAGKYRECGRIILWSAKKEFRR